LLFGNASPSTMHQIESARDFRRRRAVELMEQGETLDVIARILGTTPPSIRRWHKISKEGGSLKTKAMGGAMGGRPRKLSDDQLEHLRELLLQGATAHGWHNNLWTSKRVREVIHRHFEIMFSLSNVWTILRQYLGWTVQRPIQQLRERNDAEIERWKNVTFPRITKQADDLKAHLVFIDESGFMLTPTIRRTFAPCGQTPVNKVSNPHGRISVIGALTVSPSRKQPHFYYQLLNDNANFRGISVMQYLDELRRRIRKPMVLLWDAIPIHRAEVIKSYVHNYSTLTIRDFPPYAPELNPVDKVWFYLKYDRMANYTPTTLAKLRTKLNSELESVASQPDILSSCIRQTKLDFQPFTA